MPQGRGAPNRAQRRTSVDCFPARRPPSQRVPAADRTSTWPSPRSRRRARGPRPTAATWWPAAAAVMRSVDGGRSLHSMHSYFMRPVDIGAAVRYEVELLRDGRGYSTRQVRGFQNGKPVYAAMASFQVPEDGAGLPAAAPPPPSTPTRCPAAADVLGGRRRAPAAAYWSRPQLRHAPRARPGLPRGRGRTSAPGGVGQALRRACRTVRREATADLTGGPGLRLRLHDPRAGAAGPRPALGSAGAGHRQPGPRDVVPPRRPRLDDWLLYAQEAVSAHSGRGLGLGRFFTRARRHLATVVQEGMIRSQLSLRPTALAPPHPDHRTRTRPHHRKGTGHDHPRRHRPTWTPSPATTCRRPNRGRPSSSPCRSCSTRTGSTPPPC